ncbi:MAG: YncE family protein [Terracidiphilus sp.]
MRLFPMNSGQARARLVQAGSVLAAVALITGCGSTYRSVVTPISSSGPAAQPSSYAVTVSAPSTTTPGIATVIDYSGDSVLAIAPIGPGPTTFSLDAFGAYGYTVNSDGTLSNFPVSPSLQAKQVSYLTLPSTAEPVNLFSPTSGLWVADLDGNFVDVLTGAVSPQVFKLAIPVAITPVTVVGLGSIGQRNYAISQNIPNPTGVECNTAPSPTTIPTGLATPMEVDSYSADTPIPLGQCPVYAVQSPDGKRFFVLNRGDDTITVINSSDNTLDACTPFLNQSGQTVYCHPTLPLSLTAVKATGITPPNGTSGMTTIAGPVYAEYNAATTQLVVADYDGGTISVIDVSLDEYGNDSPTFGTTYTIPVGRNPASVTVLADGSRAYTANQTDGTVTIVTLSSHTVEKTLPVIGNPRTVVSTQNSEYGKVYVASPNSPYLTILRTDLDIVDTTILVEGNIVDVRVTTQTGTRGNINAISRIPGYGQPCNLPPSLEPAPTGTQTLLQACQALP